MKSITPSDEQEIAEIRAELSRMPESPEVFFNYDDATQEFCVYTNDLYTWGDDKEDDLRITTPDKKRAEQYFALVKVMVAIRVEVRSQVQLAKAA